MKKIVSILLSLVIGLSCVQAALAASTPSAIDCFCLKTEAGRYCFVVTYDGRFTQPGTIPEVVATYPGGSTPLTSDEILMQVLEHEGTVYPQLFIPFDEPFGGTNQVSTLNIGAGAFLDESGSPTEETSFDVTWNDFINPEKYDVRWQCSEKRDITDGHTYLAFGDDKPVTTVFDSVTEKYRDVWAAASRIYLGEERTAADQEFTLPASFDEIKVVCELNELVRDEYTFNGQCDRPDQLSSSERIKYFKNRNVEAMKDLLRDPFARAAIFFLKMPFIPIVFAFYSAFMSEYYYLSPLWYIVEGTEFFFVFFLDSLKESFDDTGYNLRTIFAAVPTERWTYDTVLVDIH